ncbi:MAG TPA: cytochrome c-type biogenesis protein CcmH [Acidimicrobiales bacterium]|nr:cytochrome c-type biogenesis protein CcmH [Acidimicrobiales bacterium]
MSAPGEAGGVRAWVPWLVLVPVLVVALAVGAGRGDGRPATPAARTAHVAAGVRCPTCEGLSAAESEAPASVAIRQEIRRRVDAGQSDAAIRSYLVGRYGSDILLTPAGSGVAALVWALPVAGLVLAAGVLAYTFRRRRAEPRRTPTVEDRLLVEQAAGQ